MRCSTVSALIVVLLGVVFLRAPARAGVRLEVPGLGRAVLMETALEDGVAWYDARAWLEALPGSVTLDPDTGRITWRRGEHWVALARTPPHALRDGVPVPVDSVPRLGDDGRLWVSEVFLRRVGPLLFGRPVRLFPWGGAHLLRIAVDPGHGGDDPGTSGPGGIEAPVALELARAVSLRLGEEGFDAFLTREDKGLPLTGRAAVANYRKADLFVSLHLSGAGRPQARGFEVFVPVGAPPGVDSDDWEAGQAGRHGASLAWATLLQRELGRGVPAFDRGLSPLPSPLLEALRCPAALVEVASLAWPQEAGGVRSAEGRDAVARAIARAAVAFAAKQWPTDDGQR